VESVTGIRLQIEPVRAQKVRSTPVRGVSLEEKFLAALIQHPARFRALPAGARQFLLDDDSLSAVYTRAFDQADQQTDAFLQGLVRDFPDEAQRISRWAVGSPVSETEFSSLLLAVRINDLRRRIAQSRGDVAKVVEMKQQLEALKSEQLRRSRSADDKG